MAEIGAADEIWQNGTLVTEENEDRISALSDSLIQHILSFLPSTKHAIRTGVLSKRWRNQWTFVSDLIFDFSGMCSDCSPDNISQTTSTISGIIDRTLSLHDCSKIRKFHIVSDSSYECIQDLSFEKKIGFAVGKQVEELVLKFSLRWKFLLPRLPSLVKLQLFGCSITKPKGAVNLKNLKDLSIENCYYMSGVIKGMVSGSPLLQSLEVKDCFYCPGRLVIASKSLKRLVVFGIDCCVDVSCPNLVEFCGQNFGLCNEVLETFLSKSPLLESLELKNFAFTNLQIASTILKKLVISIEKSNEVEISCPHLEELDLISGYVKTVRFINLPSSVCASLNLMCTQCHDGTLARQILEQLRHVNDLKFGSSFVESLSALEKDGISHPSLNCKSLTLEAEFSPSYVHISGILYALRSSPVLERLVVKLQPQEYHSLAGLSVSDHPEENYWSSNETRFCSLASHLKTVKIAGFSQREYKRNVVLEFVGFLLRKASVLEKMVVVLEDCGTDFVTEVSQKLLFFPPCSAANIELLCSK